jgi:sRNA-binding protein
MKISPLIAGITLACALLAGVEVALAAQPAPKAQPAEPAQPATKAQAPTAAQPVTKPHPAAAAPTQREITYDDLSNQIGKRVIVHTKLGTVRSGILTKVSKSSIDVTLDSGAELSIPADGIRSLSVPVSPPDPLFPTAGEPSAKTK